MPNHLNVPSIGPGSTTASASSSRHPSPAREGRSGAAGAAPRSASKDNRNRITRIKKDLSAAIKTCTSEIESIMENEAMYTQRVDNIDCVEHGFDEAIDAISKLVELKKNEVQVYDTAINKLVNLAEKFNKEGIDPGIEQTKKLDELSRYLLQRERAADALVALEAFHHAVKGESYDNDVEAAQKEYTAAADRLLELPREKWSLKLRSAQTEIQLQSGSAWTMSDVKEMDVRKLLEIALNYEASWRESQEQKIEVGFTEFHRFVGSLLTGLENIEQEVDEAASDDDDEETNEAVLRYIGYVRDVVGLLEKDDYLQETRDGIACLKQSIMRLDARKDLSNVDEIRTEDQQFKYRYESEALTMASTVLRVQHINLLHAQLSFALSPEAATALGQLQDKLLPLVVAHPDMLDEGKTFVDIGTLSQQEKKEMYRDLSILPNQDRDAARQLRYLAADLASEAVTNDSKDLPSLVARLSDLAGDFDEAANLVEVVLGELILAGVEPEDDAASEPASEDWHLTRTHSDGEDSGAATPPDGGAASPAEPASKRSSLIRSRASSLIESRVAGLQALALQSRSEIDKAKADSVSIERNVALFARQAESNKRDAQKVLDNLENSIVDDKNSWRAIYDLLNLAADRHQNRLQGLRKMRAKWEKIKIQTDEVKDRIDDLQRQIADCEQKIATLREEALLKAVKGIELAPTEEGVLFLHRHGLIAGMDRPYWIKFDEYERDPDTGQLVKKIDYIHEWPIRVRRGPGSDEIFKIFAHDHKDQKTEVLHPERLEKSRIVTWKNFFYHDKGKLWEKRMRDDGWSSLAAKVLRKFSGTRVLNMLVQHYIQDENDRVPVEKPLARRGM